MEKVLKRQRVESFTSFPYQSLFILPALLVGFIPSPYTICFVMPYLAYVYMRSNRGWIYVMVGVVISSAFVNIVYGYLFVVLFVTFCLCVQIVKYMERNIFHTLIILNMILCFIYIMVVKPSWNERFIIFGFTVLYTYLIQNHTHWSKHLFCFSRTVYGLLAYGMLLLLMQWIPSIYQMSVGLVGLTLIMLIVNHEEAWLLLMFQGFVFPEVIPFTWLLMLGGIHVLKKQRFAQALIIFIASVFLMKSRMNVYQLLFLLLLVFVYQDRFIPFLSQPEAQAVVTSDLAKKDMNQKLHNFSSIFESLALFYEKTSDVQAEMLANMSSALAYTASAMQVNTTDDDRRQRILDALAGYKYEIDDFVFEELGDGNLHIEITIKNIKRNEIKTTLLPLLEVLTNTRMVLADDCSRKFHKTYHHIVVDTAPPFRIDAYADSIKNVSQPSGDCFSIYRYRQNVICMISDGMGNGSKAAMIAHLITDMFQRMMASGIRQDHAIRCMNRLLESDTYATLDVITFDRMAGVAYISKAAACPTYLIRNLELYEIASNALPVGIIAASEPDYYVVEIKEQDLFLMASDGVYMNEITTWMKQRKKEDHAQNQIINFMEILQKSPRLDDSTVLLARVEKQF